MLRFRPLTSRVYGFFKSLKLAVILILYLVVVSILATLIPQGRALAFYTENYGPFLAWIIAGTGFNRLFRSVAFLLPMFLFFLNLATCTYHRLATRVSKGLKKRFGPDILHVGLMLLMVGGAVVALTSEEGHVNMAVGDEVDLPGGYALSLQNFELLTYDDGRPRDWISTVAVRKGTEIVEESFAIEVNRPLRVGGTRVYQFSHGSDAGLIISDPDGRAYHVRLGQSIPVEEGNLTFRDVQAGDAPGRPFQGVFDVHKDGGTVDTVVLDSGEKIGPYLIEDVFLRDTTGLRVARNSGRGLVLAALIIIVVGLSLTYIQKIGDNQL